MKIEGQLLCVLLK